MMRLNLLLGVILCALLVLGGVLYLGIDEGRELDPEETARLLGRTLGIDVVVGGARLAGGGKLELRDVSLLRSGDGRRFFHCREAVLEFGKGTAWLLSGGGPEPGAEVSIRLRSPVLDLSLAPPLESFEGPIGSVSIYMEDGRIYVPLAANRLILRRVDGTFTSIRGGGMMGRLSFHSGSGRVEATVESSGAGLEMALAPCELPLASMLESPRLRWRGCDFEVAGGVLRVGGAVLGIGGDGEGALLQFEGGGRGIHLKGSWWPELDLSFRAKLTRTWWKAEGEAEAARVRFRFEAGRGTSRRRSTADGESEGWRLASPDADAASVLALCRLLLQRKGKDGPLVEPPAAPEADGRVQLRAEGGWNGVWRWSLDCSDAVLKGLPSWRGKRLLARGGKVECAMQGWTFLRADVEGVRLESADGSVSLVLGLSAGRERDGEIRLEVLRLPLKAFLADGPGAGRLASWLAGWLPDACSLRGRLSRSGWRVEELLDPAAFLRSLPAAAAGKLKVVMAHRDSEDGSDSGFEASLTFDGHGGLVVEGEISRWGGVLRGSLAVPLGSGGICRGRLSGTLSADCVRSALERWLSNAFCIRVPNGALDVRGDVSVDVGILGSLDAPALSGRMKCGEIRMRPGLLLPPSWKRFLVEHVASLEVVLRNPALVLGRRLIYLDSGTLEIGGIVRSSPRMEIVEPFGEAVLKCRLRDLSSIESSMSVSGGVDASLDCRGVSLRFRDLALEHVDGAWRVEVDGGLEPGGTSAVDVVVKGVDGLPLFSFLSRRRLADKLPSSFGGVFGRLFDVWFPPCTTLKGALSVRRAGKEGVFSLEPDLQLWCRAEKGRSRRFGVLKGTLRLPSGVGRGGAPSFRFMTDVFRLEQVLTSMVPGLRGLLRTLKMYVPARMALSVEEGKPPVVEVVSGYGRVLLPWPEPDGTMWRISALEHSFVPAGYSSDGSGGGDSASAGEGRRRSPAAIWRVKGRIQGEPLSVTIDALEFDDRHLSAAAGISVAGLLSLPVRLNVEYGGREPVIDARGGEAEVDLGRIAAVLLPSNSGVSVEGKASLEFRLYGTPSLLHLSGGLRIVDLLVKSFYQKGLPLRARNLLLSFSDRDLSLPKGAEVMLGGKRVPLPFTGSVAALLGVRDLWSELVERPSALAARLVDYFNSRPCQKFMEEFLGWRRYRRLLKSGNALVEIFLWTEDSESPFRYREYMSSAETEKFMRSVDRRGIIERHRRAALRELARRRGYSASSGVNPEDTLSVTRERIFVYDPSGNRIYPDYVPAWRLERRGDR